MVKRYLMVTMILALSLGACSPVGNPTTSPDATQNNTDVKPTAIRTTAPTKPLAAETNLPEPPTAVESATETSLPSPSPELESIPCSGVLTSSNQEGPYYTPGSPERASLIEPGMTGRPILITGRVFDQDCQPIAGAKVDFWQADDAGEYDNQGFRLRGHVLSGQDGEYAIETIEPGPYTGRPPHIHVKVFAPDGRELLTTQLYFPGSENSGDVAAAPDLLVTYLGLEASGRQRVLFNFVVLF